MLHQVNSFLSSDVMVSLYFAFIYPYLSYCCSVWSITNKFLLCLLQRAQNREVKATFVFPCLFSSSDLYNGNGIVPLDRIVGKSNLYLTSSAFSGILPRSLLQFFLRTDSGGNSSSLQSSSHRFFFLPKRSSAAAQRSSVYQSFLLWNSVSPDVPLFISVNTVSSLVFPV